MTAALVATVVVAGLVGLAVGSFLDVVAFRVPLGLSLSRPGSYCPACDRPLAWFDNVPVVSWLALRGRCRTCGARIPGRIVAVEAGTAALFCLVAAVVRPVAAVPGCCILLATGLALGAMAADGSALAPSVTIVGTGVGAAALAVAAGTSAGWGHLVDAGIGVGAAGLAGLFGSARAGRLAIRPGLGNRSGVADGLAALVPAGAVLGWLGPWPAAGGSIVGVVVAIGAAGAASAARRSSRLPSRAEIGRTAVVAVAVLAMVGAIGTASITSHPRRGGSALSAGRSDPPPAHWAAP